jgi:hypothetical protein
MEEKELFPIDIEQEFCDFVVGEIDGWLDGLPMFLSSVDVAGQRRELENKGKAYRESRPQPYFGVVADVDLETDEVLETFRIGLRAIFDRRSTAIVMSWTSDEGRKFAQLEKDLGGSIFGANVDIDHCKVMRIAESNKEKAARRRGRIESARSSSLDNIIDVILPEQDDVVRIDHNGPLIIEGGPGTGKTVVALQRIAYLMSRDLPSISNGNEVLIIGPTKAYVNYVENFLPKLGLGPVTNEDFDSICLRRLSVSQRQELATLRIDPPLVRKSKNTPRMIRLMHEAVWPKELRVNVMARVAIGMGKPESRYIDSAEIIAIVHQLRVNFNSDTFSYNRCRRQLEIELQNRLINDRIEDERSEGGTSLARRNRLVESWIQKIGKHSQKNRFDAQEKIDSPLGGRIKRELLTIVNKYYQEDIEIGIDLIAETGLLDVRKLEEALIEVGVTTKGAGRKSDGITNNGAETVDLKDISLAQVQAAKSGAILSQVSQIVDRILPNRDVLVVAKRICSGEPRFFQAVLGEEGKAIAKRFSEASVTQTKTKKYVWSDADLPVIAEISFLIEGNDGHKRFSHVVVDEAQDLTRLQSRVISRYVSGTQITLVGDPNQATRVGYLDSWDSITEAIGLWGDELKFAEANIEICRLEHNFRVPENIYDYARLYLAESERVNTPSCDTLGGSVEIIEADPKQVIKSLSSNIATKVFDGARVAVITDDEKIRAHVAGLGYENVTVLGPEESKGLEVDHSILVQPHRWFKPSERIRNLMYVVLTRATKSVTILQHQPEKYEIHIPVNPES